MKNNLKKVLTIAISGILSATALTSVASALPSDPTDIRLGKYDFDTYMYPVWGGGAVYQENLVFYEDANGKVNDTTLLYTPDKMVSVRNFGLNVVYEEGKDYTIQGNVIHRTETSKIPVMPRSAYCDVNSTASPQLLDDAKGGALISDNTVLQKYYLSVSYLHSQSYTGKIPTNELDHLPTLKAKLESKEPVTIAILGDSISAGYSTSGLNDPSYNVKGQQITIKVNIAPYMPTWPKLVAGMLQKAYGYSDITVVNCGIGGTNTNSACLTDMIGRVTAVNPDLVIIGFGMNEYWGPANQHGDRIEGICNNIHNVCPTAGFVLLSSMTPNIIARDPSTFHFAEFETEYYSIQNDRKADLEIAVAPLNTVYSFMRTKKDDFSLVGGNNNHPNDFTVRLYAQTVASVLGAYDVPYFLMNELPEGQINTDYNAKFSGWCALNYQLSVEGLPAGLTLSANGTVSGTPTETGVFDVTVTATSTAGTTVSTCKLTIAETPVEKTPVQDTPIVELEEKGGCKSVVGESAAVLAGAVAGGFLIAKKKKKEN